MFHQDTVLSWRYEFEYCYIYVGMHAHLSAVIVGELFIIVGFKDSTFYRTSSVLLTFEYSIMQIRNSLLRAKITSIFFLILYKACVHVF